MNTMGAKNKMGKVFGVTAVLLIGLIIGFVLSSASQGDSSQDLQQRYNLLSKRSLVENPNDIILDFRPLRRQLEEYISKTSAPDSISLYFEYLPSGSSIGVNENKEVVGASLLKLPVVMQIYKYAEEGQIDLDEKVPLKKEWLDSGYGSLYKQGAGHEVSIRDATTYAIEKSDNTAILLLFDRISQLQKTNKPSILDFVDANYDINSDEQILIGAQSYSSILKCLYFACYLGRDNSQDILQKLTNTDSANRLPLHIPNKVPIAHKIGSYDNIAQSDCGIFYVEKRNYLLCVMIGTGDSEASEYIADLSEIAYKAVVSQ
jgi:beta-lactamase class A